MGDEGIPLVGISNKNNKGNMAANFLRTTSCIGEPSDNALVFLLNDDQVQMRNLLAEICPVEDGGKLEAGKKSKPPPFPLQETHWINKPYDADHGHKTLLQLAVERGQEDMVKAMLSAGARADHYNPLNGKALVHVAFKSLPMLKILLDFMPNKPLQNRANIGAFNNEGQTVLHLAAAENQIEVLRYLLKHDSMTDLDPKDMLGRQTPLYVAAKKGKAEACELLIAHGASLSAKSWGKTPEEVMGNTLPYFDVSKVKRMPPRSPKKWSVADRLATLLDQAQMNLRKGLSNAQNHLQFTVFLQQIDCAEFDNYDSSGMGLFQKAASYGLDEHVLTMLENKMDPNAARDGAAKPVLMAAHGGYYKVLKVLKDHKSKKDDNHTDFSVLEKFGGESVLHWVLKKPNPVTGLEACNYDKCFDVLMEDESEEFNSEIDKTVNHKDDQKLTPLHYASQNWPQACVRTLLERGGNVGMRDLYDVTPISLIPPDTMEDFLNDFCLKSNDQEITDEKFELTFEYSFLAPPVDDPKYDEKDPEGQRLVEQAALPETDTLWFLSQSKDHCHLLDHPVVMSFLWLKWQRIRGYFNRNVRFFLLFVTCLSWYVFERFGGVTSRSTTISPNATSFCNFLTEREEVGGPGFWYFVFAAQVILQGIFFLRDLMLECSQCNMRSTFQCLSTGWVELITVAIMVALLIFSTSVLWLVLTILMVMLVMREAFQIAGSLKRYVISPENWLEVVMISLVGYILWSPSDLDGGDCNLKRHLAAVAIVLSWAELITLVAKHPRLSRYNVYVTMFYKVMTTFLYFLVWYSFFIIAFGFGFYIMLHKDLPGVDLSESDYTFFNYPFLTLVKTSTMFVGEIEFADIPVDIDDPTSASLGYLFLISFVFLIIVVLMNLLNGLAVSDTGIIREKAKIMSAKSRVETISYLESLMLGDPFDFLSNWPPFRWVRALPSLSLCRCLSRNSTVRDAAHRATGATGILLFYSMLPDKRKTVLPNKRSASCTALREMSSEVISASKAIVRRQREDARRQREMGDKEAKVEKLAQTVENLEEKLNKIMAAFNIK